MRIFVGQPDLKSSLPAYCLFFVSGLTGLVYQVLWLRQFTLIFGATAYASSAVLSTFMGGLALGSYWAGRRADRWLDSPLRAYGRLELGIAVYAALIPFLLELATPLLESAWRLGADRHFAWFGLVKFLAIALLVLPATTMMGATLPVLSRVVARSARSVGGGVGALYAVNTLGAVAGTVACAFFVLPAFGMKRTLIANLALNVAIGAMAWIVGGSVGRTPTLAAEESTRLHGPQRSSGPVVLAFAVSGFAAMVLEVAWTRGLALVFGSSVYAYASMLTAFLLGLAFGAASAARFLDRRRGTDPRMALAIVLGAAGLLSFAATFAIQELPRLSAAIHFGMHPSAEGWWIAQVGMALIVMFPTTYALGWVFPLVLETTGAARGAIAASVGRVYAANTIGTIVGAAGGGFILIPAFGVGTTLVGVAVVQVLLGAALLPGAIAGTVRSRRWLAASLALVAVLCVALRPGWDVVLMNSGVYLYVDDETSWKEFIDGQREDNHVVYARDGLTTTVVVGYQPTPEDMYLTVNGKADATSFFEDGDLETQVLLGQLPLLLHPTPRDVMVIGLGSGITSGSVGTHSVDHIRVIEVEGVMVGAARAFAPFNREILDDPRVAVSINDARNELQFNPMDYDVIVSEPSNPWMTVASNLFTREFFQLAKTRLRPGGIFEQWVQLYRLAPEHLRSILSGFHEAFPNVLVFGTSDNADLLLLGSDQPLILDIAALDRRMSNLWVRADLARVEIHDATDLASRLQTGGDSLAELVRGAAQNTDDNGLVEFAAPKALYQRYLAKNLALVRRDGDDPVRALSPILRTETDEETLRLELIRRWIQSGSVPRAAKAAACFANRELKAEAEELLRAAP